MTFRRALAVLSAVAAAVLLPVPAHAADAGQSVNRAVVRVQGTFPAATQAAVVRGMRELTGLAPVQSERFTLAVGTTAGWLAAVMEGSAGSLFPGEAARFRDAVRRGELRSTGDWAYSIRGPGMQLVLVKPRPGADASAVALAALQEAAEGLAGWWGGRSPGYPCWAAEGWGKPFAFAAWGRATGRDGQAALRAWLASAPAVRPSPARYAEAEAFGAGCKESGTGHRLGGALSAMLVGRFGTARVLAWPRAAAGPDWRAVFRSSFGMTVEQAYEQASARWPAG
jgi:hypothetical protein